MKKQIENRCCNCKYATYGENGNPICTCGNKTNELKSRYFGCYHAPIDSKEDK